MNLNNKLVYVSDAELSSFRANAIHVMKMCNAFSFYCSKVTLYCLEWDKSKKTFHDYGVPNSFEIKSCGCKFPKFILPTIKLIISGFLNANRIRKENKDAYVYGRSIWTLFFMNKRRPFSYEVHSIPNKFLYRFLERRVLKRDSLVNVVGISEPLIDVYRNTFPRITKEKFIVLHDGADSLSKDVEKAVLSKRDCSNVHIGYIGSLYSGKCMETLFPVVMAMPDVFFHIVGGAKYYIDYWMKKCSENNVVNIEFYGNIPPNKVNNYYQAFDIILLPYSEDIYIGKNKKYNIGKWISPLKLFEAMSNSKPIIVTSLNSINSILSNGEDSIIVKASDINGWINAINSLRNDSDLRLKLGHNALIKFESKYTWKKRAELIINRYHCSEK